MTKKLKVLVEFDIDEGCSSKSATIAIKEELKECLDHKKEEHTCLPEEVRVSVIRDKD